MSTAAETIPESLFLSPYLGTYVRGTELVIDNFVTMQHQTLDQVGSDVVRALWNAADPIEALRPVIEQHSAERIAASVRQLSRSAVLFRDRQACDLFLDTVLETTSLEVPFIDQAELTSYCPMKCQFCPRGIDDFMQRPSGFMELGLFRRLLEEMHPEQPSYRPLELHHQGESLLHPEVHLFVAAAREKGIQTELSANPSHLSPELSRKLLDAGIRRLIISLDGIDNETLAAIRGPAAKYDRAEQNLGTLLERVAGMAEPPEIVIQMIDLFRNRHQHQAFLTRWGTTGLPTVSAQIKRLDGNDPDTGKPSSDPNTFLCTYPWRSVVVLWDGRVVPCCKDADAKNVLGDLKNQSLREIWSGSEARALRRLHRGQEIPCGHLCSGCSWLRENFVKEMPMRHPDRAKPDPLRW